MCPKIHSAGLTQVEPVDENLLHYLVAELITRTVITSEAHKRVYNLVVGS